MCFSALAGCSASPQELKEDGCTEVIRAIREQLEADPSIPELISQGAESQTASLAI